MNVLFMLFIVNIRMKNFCWRSWLPTATNGDVGNNFKTEYQWDVLCDAQILVRLVDFFVYSVHHKNSKRIFCGGF